MGHDHGDGSPEHSHGGSAPGLGWTLLDGLMLVCALIVCGLLAEVAWKAWQAKRAGRVRYSLTPEGEAATTPTPRVGEPGQPPLVDLEALAADVARRDQEDAARRDAAAVLDQAREPAARRVTPTGTDYLRRKAQGQQ